MVCLNYQFYPKTGHYHFATTLTFSYIQLYFADSSNLNIQHKDIFMKYHIFSLILLTTMGSAVFASQDPCKKGQSEMLNKCMRGLLRSKCTKTESIYKDIANCGGDPFDCGVDRIKVSTTTRVDENCVARVEARHEKCEQMWKEIYQACLQNKTQAKK